tara:strand:+ start:367 stop:927 length:561 start_codon:yes stop_codon:yes gene_type:complete
MNNKRQWKNFLKESKLRIFDFDDTLVKTDATVKVTSPSGKVEEYTPGQFSNHKIDEKNKYDFSDFNKVINPREIKKVTNILRNVLNASGDRNVVVLTARDPKSQTAIEDYLVEIGIDPGKINIVLLANPDPAAKANWIENKIVDGATDILFLDDSGKNIKAVKALGKQYPNVKIDAREVDYAEEIE